MNDDVGARAPRPHQKEKSAGEAPALRRTSHDELAQLGKDARAASKILRQTDRATKDRALLAAAKTIRAHRADILAANAEDLKAAHDLTPALRDRLLLDDTRIEAVAKGLEDIAALPDPVGRELARWQRPNGLDIARVST